MKGLIIGGIVVASVLVFVVGNYITYKNYAVRAEAGIEASYTDNKNVLSNYTTQVMEAASVTEMARDDLSKVIEGALAARYGTAGSQSVFNWIKENYPGQVDAKLYQKLQQIIESGRNDFKVAQTALIDKLRIYEVQRNQVWSGLWISIAGYPKKDLSEFKIIVTDDVTEKFNTGKDAPVTLRPKSS